MSSSADFRSSDRPQPRVCVIGAGPCGLTAIKNLLAADVYIVVFYDEGDAIGGNWVFSEAKSRTSVYFSTLGNQSCGTPTGGGCAVKLTQAAFQ